MTKSRLEAFSDGVIAIIITIMVLELKIPQEATFAALGGLANIFMSYLVSFVFIGIYWGNHHHLLQTVHYVNSKIIWANMALLFCLSLIPFTTGWVGRTDFAKVPVAFYAINLTLCGESYYILQRIIKSHYTLSTRLTEALLKQEKKGLISLVLLLAAIACAFIYPLVASGLIAATAILWIIPDKNIEEALKGNED